MRAPVDHISAPPFPRQGTWIGVATLRMDQQIGRPVLIEFWDFCRPNSIRTLPYMKSWHERYADHGLRVIGIHTAGFEPSQDPQAVADACRRLEVPYPVLVDSEREMWESYGNLGWPARYLFNQEGKLFDYHYGEGAYEDTEAAIQELLGLELPPLEPQRPEDAAGVLLEPQSPDAEGPYSGPYRAGEVWVVTGGAGTLAMNGSDVEIEGPGCQRLIRHPHSTESDLVLAPSPGPAVYATCFIPGLQPTRRAD